MSEAWQQISLAKGPQRFIFRYGPGEEANVMAAFRALANDPRSGFEWFDAAVLAFKMTRRLERKLQLAKSKSRAKSPGQGRGSAVGPQSD